MNYLSKKQSAAARGIEFTFTPLEWEYFQSLQYRLPCAYTGKEFIREHTNGKCYPTIERVDNKGPYSYDNCVWVTSEANRTKSIYIENEPKESHLIWMNWWKLYGMLSQM